MRNAATSSTLSSRARLSPHARDRWSIASRTLAAVGGGYALTSLANVAVPLLLGALGVNVAEALLATTMVSFLVYAGIIMAVFHARSATRAWIWLVAAVLLLAVIAFAFWSEAVVLATVSFVTEAAS